MLSIGMKIKLIKYNRSCFCSDYYTEFMPNEILLIHELNESNIVVFREKDKRFLKASYLDFDLSANI